MGRKCFLSFICCLAIVYASSILTVGAENGRAYIILVYGNLRFQYEDELIEPTDHLVSQQIFDRKLNAPLPEKLALVMSKVRSGADYKSAMLWCFPLLENTVKEARSKIDASPVDSEIRFSPGKRNMFEISRDKVGVEMIEERLYMEIYFALTTSDKVTVNIPVRHIPANVTMGDNIKLTNLRSVFSTDCSLSTDERKHNIALALSKINGSVIGKDEVFSFNAKVGRRTAQNGFKEAKIIVGGQYTKGLGGGVCQASTTLYNAALRADLVIEEVNRHTLQSSYVSPSFDAMVNSGSSDLVIRNGGETPVFICAYCDGNRAYVRIYGSKMKYKIKCKSEVTFTGETPSYDKVVDNEHKYFDEEEPSGTTKILSYSHPEVHSRGYLLYYDENDRLIDKKLIRTDKYMAVKGTMAVAP